MINQISVLNTVTANGADVQVDNFGMLNIKGLPSIPAATVLNVEKISYNAEQIKKQRLTFTSQNSYTYTFTIDGYALSTGVPVTKLISWTSTASNTTALTSAAITTLINAQSDFNVVASDIGSGVVALIGTTASAACPKAPLFTVNESDSNIAPTALASVAFTAAPTGGRTATGIAVISDAGAVTDIIITDPGAGYLAAPAVTVSNGGGTSGAATTVIFEGEVVGILAVTAGSGYLSRPGVLVQGTPAALQAKYNYVASSANSPSAPSYPALANLTSGYTYTEWIISFQLGAKSGITTFAQTETTGQFSLIVYNSATNAATLNAAYGQLTNLRKGYKSSIEAAVALNGTSAVTTTTFVNTSGAWTLSAATSNGVKAGDIVLCGTTPAFGNTADTNGIGKILGYTTGQTILLVQIGGGNLTADITTQTLATSFVKRENITR